MERRRTTQKSSTPLLSAGAVVVRKTEDGFRYLLLRAYKHWDFPKGLVEPGEDPIQAAIREIEEETTIKDLGFPWGYDFRETEPYGPAPKIARYYLAETRSSAVELPISAELGHPEHDEYRWLSYEQARALLHPRVQPIIDWAHSCISR